MRSECPIQFILVDFMALFYIWRLQIMKHLIMNCYTSYYIGATAYYEHISGEFSVTFRNRFSTFWRILKEI
jgi:hypothetical protein